MTSIVDLADQVAAAADLDDAARREVNLDLEVGDSDWAICDALLATKKPLPPTLLQEIRAGVDAGWYSDADTRKLVVDALDKQDRHHAA